jgi:hypothetical protein
MWCENLSEALFCDSCGAPLAERVAEEERKVVTVRSVDAVRYISEASELSVARRSFGET